MQPTLQQRSQKCVRLEWTYPVALKSVQVSRVRPRLRASCQPRARLGSTVSRRMPAQKENEMTAPAIDGERLLADSIAGKFPDAHGRFGPFGGRYVPETLIPALERLEEGIQQHLNASDFQIEYKLQLKSWVGRPTALTYAARLSERWGAKIWLKREDLAHTGAHKINNAIGQALLAQRLGAKRIVAEPGAGQHGVASAAACARLGLPCTVYMGAVDMERQAPNVGRMRLLGRS